MYNNIVQGLYNPNQTHPGIQNPNFEIANVQSPVQVPSAKLFDVNDFVNDLADKSAEENMKRELNSNNINSYDIASNCIRQVIFKILNYPVQNYENVWLPVIMRAKLGNAVHEFIQDNATVFTEAEVALRIPSKRLSIRLDNLINDNVLVEIKSCTYSDYAKIINTKRPRDPDFYQSVLYRYILHNYLDEAHSQPPKARGSKPKLTKYNIDTIQIIYAAHDLLSSDCTSVSEAVNEAKTVKKLLNSKHNKFFYITALTIDLNTIDITPYEAYIVEKLDTINYHLNTNTIPSKNNKFVNSKSCFFCLYKDVCKTV